MVTDLPACCVPSPGASPAEVLYCAYNAAGDPATAGRSWDGHACPTWDALPPNVRAKWEAVAIVRDFLDKHINVTGSPGPTAPPHLGPDPADVAARTAALTRVE